MVIPKDLVDTPQVLIEINSKNEFELNQRTIKLLHQLDTPVVVIGIAGAYRTGKSCLMNLLAGKTSGFALGSTVQGVTKGIWIWCLPHPTFPNTTLILMDTEGLNDFNGDDDRDMQIIVLALLLSSTFIFNTIGRIDSSLIKQLGFVSELTKYIRVRVDNPEDDEEFDYYFPALVVTIRDFCLELAIDEKPVTPDEYFDISLQLKETSIRAKNERKIAEYNEPRIKIRRYFPDSKRYCEVLPPPIKDLNAENLKKLALAPRENMSPAFLEESECYVKLVLAISECKSVGNCDRVNGRMFADMAAAYLSALSNGETPCIQSALKLTASHENRRIIEQCLKECEDVFSKVVLPLSLGELIKIRNDLIFKLSDDCNKKLIFLDQSRECLKEFGDNFDASFKKLESRNREVSRSKCENLLEALNFDINTNYGNKVYMCPGGHDIYKRDLESLKTRYAEISNKGVMSDEVLSEFLKSKKLENDVVFQMDETMTLSKIREENERARRQESQLREKMLRDEIEADRMKREAMKKSLKESERKLQNEMDKRITEQRLKYDKIISERQAAQEKIQIELKREIQNLNAKLERQSLEMTQVRQHDVEDPENYVQICRIRRVVQVQLRPTQ